MSGRLSQSKLQLRTGAFNSRYLPLAMLPAAGGIALVMHILAGASLLWAYVSLAALGGIVWLLHLSRGSTGLRRDLRGRAKTGACAGLIATFAYDGVRYGLVSLMSWSLDPFKAWSLFGAAVIGDNSSGGAQFAVGIAYHLLNGIGFGLTFALIVRRPTWWLGVLWGLVLELLMALLYPQWMRISQLEEFLTMSVVGHVVYGAVLGTLCGLWVGGRRDAQ